MKKKIEMYDKVVKKIDENIQATRNRIEQVSTHMSSDGSLHTPTAGFINELHIEIRLWKEIRAEIETMKDEHKKHFLK